MTLTCYPGAANSPIQRTFRAIVPVEEDGNQRLAERQRRHRRPHGGRTPGDPGHHRPGRRPAYQVEVRFFVYDRHRIYNRGNNECFHSGWVSATGTPQGLTAVWSADLTAKEVPEGLGCSDSKDHKCTNTAVLSDNEFTYRGTAYRVRFNVIDVDNNKVIIRFSSVVGSQLPTVTGTQLNDLLLLLEPPGGSSSPPFPLKDATRGTGSRIGNFIWTTSDFSGLAADNVVKVSLVDPNPKTMTVTASGPLLEGVTTNVYFTLDQPTPAWMPSTL